MDNVDRLTNSRSCFSACNESNLGLVDRVDVQPRRLARMEIKMRALRISLLLCLSRLGARAQEQGMVHAFGNGSAWKQVPETVQYTAVPENGRVAGLGRPAANLLRIDGA